jgi:hypothetical protein
MMTPAGAEALRIARWAWEDPAGRVQIAIEQVRGMASAADGQDLREIQDAGTMLSRLAGTLDTEPVTGDDTLIGQLAGDTIVSQLVELANEAWMHERRGKGGKWVSAGGEIERTAKGAARIKRIQAAQARHAPAPSTGKLGGGSETSADDHLRQLIREEIAKAASGVPADIAPENKAAEVAFQVGGKVVPTKREQMIHQQLIASKIEPLAASKAAAAVAEAKKVVEQKLEESQKLAAEKEQTHEVRKARLKLAVEASLAVTGGILATLAAKAGAPEAVTIFATVGPFLIQTIIEWYKKLLCRRRFQQKTASS